MVIPRHKGQFVLAQLRLGRHTVWICRDRQHGRSYAWNEEVQEVGAVYVVVQLHLRHHAVHGVHAVAHASIDQRVAGAPVVGWNGYPGGPWLRRRIDHAFGSSGGGEGLGGERTRERASQGKNSGSMAAEEGGRAHKTLLESGRTRKAGYGEDTAQHGPGKRGGAGHQFSAAPYAPAIVCLPMGQAVPRTPLVAWAQHLAGRLTVALFWDSDTTFW